MKSGMKAFGAAAALATFVLVNTSRADTIVRPSDLTGPTFSYDTDSLAPTAETGQSTLGVGAFTASVTNGNNSPDQTQAGQGQRYRTFRVSLSSLFSGPVTVGSLDSFSYDNQQLSGQNTWRITIYAGGPSASTFYTSRIQANPTDLLSTFQTESSSNLSFYDNGSGTGTKVNQNTPVSWSTMQGFDASEAIQFVDITLGANNGGGTESANLDNVKFTVNGVTQTLDLEPNAAPLPNSAVAGIGLFGVLGIAGVLRRRRAAL